VDKKTFVATIMQCIPIGTKFRNPSNIGTISSYSDDVVKYTRGNSSIRIRWDVLFDVLNTFKNQMVSSTDLKTHNFSVFDSEGHPCNCTFVFLVFLDAGFANEIKGEGKSRNPFRAFIFPTPQKRQPDWKNPYLVPNADTSAKKQPRDRGAAGWARIKSRV
jgi:hypothetical protein